MKGSLPITNPTENINPKKTQIKTNILLLGLEITFGTETSSMTENIGVLYLA